MTKIKPTYDRNNSVVKDQIFHNPQTMSDWFIKGTDIAVRRQMNQMFEDQVSPMQILKATLQVIEVTHECIRMFVGFNVSLMFMDPTVVDDTEDECPERGFIQALEHIKAMRETHPLAEPVVAMFEQCWMPLLAAAKGYEVEVTIQLPEEPEAQEPDHGRTLH